MKHFYEEKFANPDGEIRPETDTIVGDGKPTNPPDEEEDLPE